MKAFVRNNGLTIALVVMFLFSSVGMIWSGLSAYNDELHEHGSQTVTLLRDLSSGDFLSAFFENWGKRIPADVGVCHADGPAVSTWLCRVARSR